MNGISASQLADKLNLSRGRISQMVSSGLLDGCHDGTGRQRRFDLEKCAAAYRGLDPGQGLGNGAKTRKAIAGIKTGSDDAAPAPREPAPAKPDDDDGYQLARTQKAIEETRRLRRANAEAEGSYVLVSEVETHTRRLLLRELAEIEAVLRDGARRVADDLGVDFKQVRQILLDQWRGHRARRSRLLAQAAPQMAMNEAEQEADI